MKTGGASEYVDMWPFPCMAVPAEVLALGSGALEGLRRKSAQGGANYAGADVNTERRCQEGIERS